VDSCYQCGRRAGLVFQELCRECLTNVLVKQLPRLKRALEMKHGAVLDSWLAEGKLVQSGWQVSDDLKVTEQLVKDLLKAAVQDAVAREEIALRLPKDETWKPIELESLMSYIYKQCVDSLSQFITQLLVEAMSSAPTEEAERELVDIVSGKKKARHRYLRERAVEVLTLSKATPFTLPAIALIEMRYQADKGKELYTELVDDKISSVWDEVRDSLPEEVAKLISADNTF
jgi:hypothetical protein